MIFDTGPLVAAAVRTDPDHDRCRELLETHPGELIVPVLVVAEVAVEPTVNDWSRMAELVEQYRDLRLGGVDASVVALAERRGEQIVATLDRRHFSVVRPRHQKAFTLLP